MEPISLPNTVTYRNVAFTFAPVTLDAELMDRVRAAVEKDGQGFRAFFFIVHRAHADDYAAIRQFRVPTFTAANAMDFARFIHTKYKTAALVECRIIAE